MGTPSVELRKTETARLPIVPLVISIFLGILLSVALIGGAACYLLYSGKLKLQTASPPKEFISTKTHRLVLEPLTVNLADMSETAYLRVSLVLDVANGPQGTNSESKNEEAKQNSFSAAVRDAAITVLSRQTSEALLSVSGKEKIKHELKEALVVCDPHVNIVDLYFTEFLVQR